MRYTSTMFCLCSVVFTSACSKKDANDNSAKPAEGSAAAVPAIKPTEAPAPSASPSKITTAKLERLKLQIDVPGEAAVSWSETMGTEIDADGIRRMSVIDQPGAKSLDDEKQSNVRTFKPQNVKAEKLADGWWTTFETTVGGDRAYPVFVQRVLAGHAYLCSVTAFDPAEQANVLAACKTLRPY
ncbi:MAG: uncharacterized protein JWO36_6171 [Myxococcales bacterium]|nr:uncharacterized protein [Myxococcales bacterium]